MASSFGRSVREWHLFQQYWNTIARTREALGEEQMDSIPCDSIVSVSPAVGEIEGALAFEAMLMGTSTGCEHLRFGID